MSQNYLSNEKSAILFPYSNAQKIDEQGYHLIERGEGVYVYDDKGKKYIEGLAGLWCTSLGYGNKELQDAAYEQLGKLSFSHLFNSKAHEPGLELAERIKEMSPVQTSKVFFTNSGSEANDTQIKIQWYYNNAIGKEKRKKIISRQRAYHGVTIASGSLTGLPVVQNGFDLPIENIIHTKAAYYYREASEGESEEQYSKRLADELEDLIIKEGPETIAAFIAEPVCGAGGVLVPPKNYFYEVQKVLNKYDIYFISDEVICGFGRLGADFGCQKLGTNPNSISMAKALSSGYMPIGALTIPEDVYSALIDANNKYGVFGHGYTYSGHPVACAVANKTLEIYKRDKIFEHVKKVSPLFLDRLNKLKDNPLVGDARGLGLVGAIEIVKDKKTKEPFDPSITAGAIIAKKAEEYGVILRALGDNIAMCPPLIISEDEISQMFDVIEAALNDGLELLASI